MESRKLEMKNNLKAIRHYDNKAIRNNVHDVCGKFGFTLAEILIVLTIIGVMAVMTIPSLIQNANSQHKVALFKKAFNALSNAYATEFAVKTPPKSWNDGETSKGGMKVFDAISNQMNIKYYVKLTGADYSVLRKVFTRPTANASLYWSIAEDGISYRVFYGNTDRDCPSKLDLNKCTATETVRNDISCIFIVVDVDGPFNGPNANCNDGDDINNLSGCDIIRFWVTSDGITSGNPDCTISGRIISGNTKYDTNACANTCE